MAAWIVVGGVMGLVVGLVLGGWVVGKWDARSWKMEERLREAMQPQPGDKEMLERVLDRLLGAVVPEPRVDVPLPDDLPPGHEAEYEPPAPEVGDWTDPFFALGSERQMVGRLAPGQGVPVGVQGSADGDGEGESPVEAWRERGEGAFEEWMRETVLPDEVAGNGQAPIAWVDPVRLEDE